MFDGSSIAGWKAINRIRHAPEADLSQTPMDPFFAASTMTIFCDVLDPISGQPYERDPRSIAKRAEAYLKSTGVGDTAYFGPEAEFFVFDDVKFAADMYNTGFKVDSVELPTNGMTDYEGGNLGHRVAVKGGYFPVPPNDSAQDMRGEMLAAMASMGVKVEKHHHEVASAQHELGMKFDTLVTMADHMQLYKYCIHNVAQSYGKSATFMPKPVYGDNGSACTSTSRSGRRQAGVRRRQVRRPLRDLPVLHRRRHQARQGDQRVHEPVDQLVQATGPRLRGAGSPRLLGAQPLGLLPYPVDELAEGQACGSALPRPDGEPVPRLLGPHDGRPRWHRQQDPSGEAMDKDLYDLPPRELKKIPTVCGSLREALNALDKDRGFLKAGGVFSDDMIDAYIELKMQDVIRFEHTRTRSST